MNATVWISVVAAITSTSSALAAAGGPATDVVNLLPRPASVERRDGSFRIAPATQVVAEGQAAAEASKLVEMLSRPMGWRLALVGQSPSPTNILRMRIDPLLKERLGDEGYELDVTPQSVTILASEPAGLFYAGQTLLQLLPTAVFSPKPVEGIEWAVPCVRITDRPRFRWRGLLIDPARHFIPVADVERYIDVMALHKFNRLQIHLTDDQGWRIEIKKYPLLVEVGTKMDFTTLQEGKGTADGRRPSGFYTQDDIRRLVRYAADRHVTIVPEIEMPAHTGAAIVSYPRLGLYPEKLTSLPIEERWTANERVLAPRPESAAFMQDVLAEVAALFPSRQIHIGGDEANIAHWKQSEEMQAMIRRLGLKDETELHSWFIGQMDAFLTKLGRQLVGWDEILQGGLAPGAIVMSWRGTAGGITAAQAGHDVVMAPTSHTYFDYYQGPTQTEPRAIGGLIPLQKVYEFEPVPEALDAAQARHVLGGQGQLWGEYIADRRRREYMTYPRAAALAEVLWSSREGRDYAEFTARLADHVKRLELLGVNYRPLD